MSEEYEMLKAQFDALDKKSKQKHIDQGSAAERERIRKAVEGLKEKAIKDPFTSINAYNKVLALLNDGDGE